MHVGLGELGEPLQQHVINFFSVKNKDKDSISSLKHSRIMLFFLWLMEHLMWDRWDLLPGSTRQCGRQALHPARSQRRHLMLHWHQRQMRLRQGEWN